MQYVCPHDLVNGIQDSLSPLIPNSQLSLSLSLPLPLPLPLPLKDEDYQELTPREESDLERMMSQTENAISNLEAFTDSLSRDLSLLDGVCNNMSHELQLCKLELSTAQLNWLNPILITSLKQSSNLI